MATPTITQLNFTEIDDADTNASWTTLTTADPDILKEGTNSMSGTMRSDLDTAYYDDATTRSASGKHLRAWINTINLPYMEDTAGGGYELYMYDGSSTQYITVFSSDDYFGGWANVVIDCALYTSLTLANVVRWGLRVNHTATGKNAINVWMDWLRYSDGYYFTGGTSGDEVTLMDIASSDRSVGYGIIEEVEGVYLAYGKFQIGNGATTTYFEMDGDVLVFTDQPVANGLFAINGNGSGANITITNSTIKTAGTSADTRVDVDMSTSSPNAVSITDTVFIRCGTFVFASGQTITGNTFNDCQQITHGGADMDACVITGYEGTADTASLVYNVNADPDGEMDGMSITKGTASTHAIEFGSTCPTTMTLRDIAFSGYNASNGQTDSTLYFSSTGSQNYTVNLVGCSGNISYKTHASFTGTVSLVVNPVALTVTTKTSSGGLIENARVLVEVADGTNWPYQDSVSITRSGTTATVTHTGHGLASNDFVVIKNCTTVPVFNGSKQITVSGTNTYTFTTEAQADILVDNYPETEKDLDRDIYSGSNTRAAQSFIDYLGGGNLTTMKFYIRKQGSPTGSVYAKLYSDSGDAPNTILDTSSAVDISTLGTSFALQSFTFTGGYTFVKDTKYWISIEYTGGDSSNRLEVGMNYINGSHPGNGHQVYISSWSTSLYYPKDDLIFYVYRQYGNTDTGGNATLAVISELTNASGIATESRTYATADQPITGWARKSTSAPYYKQGTITGTIDKDTGLSLVVILASGD